MDTDMPIIFDVTFQSTPPRGWRHEGDLEVALLPDFNPLHREGGDIVALRLSNCSFNFNPLHREGGDPIMASCGVLARTFQSTPPRGWRRKDLNNASDAADISIHSTARVETTKRMIPTWRLWDFNPLHREGGDASIPFISRSISYFNPLHREGGDDIEEPKKNLIELFQSTPPRGWRRWWVLCG